MKIVSINTVSYGSTGKIMLQIADHVRKQGHEVTTFSTVSGKQKQVIENHHFYCTYFEYCVHYVLGKLTGGNGLFSVAATIRLLYAMKKIAPDIVHLHNLHGFCINLPMLFSWLKKSRVKVIWTLHDCWAFTGHCSHFDMANCEKWKSGCSECPIYRAYPESIVDNSRYMWLHKKKWFTGLSDLTLVTPSQWLADLTRNSFLSSYPVKVIHNGIDLNVFKPTISNIREKLDITSEQYLVLGVAMPWSNRKGLDVFIEMAKRLSNDYRIVLVGTDEKMEVALPANITAIHRTHDQKELAEIYTAADVFVNPTREDNFPTVNLEALACGTPVATFYTGGSPECIDNTCGIVVPKDNITAMEESVRLICEKGIFTDKACLQRAKAYAMEHRFEEYLSLYCDRGFDE